MNMKKLMIIMPLLLIASCDEIQESERLVRDQCLRQEIFFACMKGIPQGPKNVVNNDWAEVIAECENAAYYQSLRKRKAVKPECVI